MKARSCCSAGPLPGLLFCCGVLRGCRKTSQPQARPHGCVGGFLVEGYRSGLAQRLSPSSSPRSGYEALVCWGKLWARAQSFPHIPKTVLVGRDHRHCPAAPAICQLLLLARYGLVHHSRNAMEILHDLTTVTAGIEPLGNGDATRLSAPGAGGWAAAGPSAMVTSP